MNVLRRGCRSLPDMEQIQAALDECYGASVEPAIRQYGEALAIGFDAVFPDDRWLPAGSRNLERILKLVSRLALEPDTSGGLLRAEYVRSEGRNLRDRILAAVNDKRSYAQYRARQLMCAGEAYGVYPLGSAEEAEKITNRVLTRHGQTLLDTSPVRMFYCGSAPFDRVRDGVLLAFQMLAGSERRVWPETEIKTDCGELRSETEYMEVEQGNLVLGCRLGAAIGQREQPALAVFNEIFGGGPGSKLFREVRESRSLCYHIGSGFDRHKSVLTVAAGIAFSRRDEVVAAVLELLDCCAKGEISAEELETARRCVATDYRMLSDSGAALSGFYLGQALLCSEGSPEQYAALAGEVTVADVARVAARIKPDLVYFLRGNEKEGAEA